MMRLVFLFSAEERGLLHLGKPLYDNNYAVSTLQEQLQEVADLYGEEVLERRTDAWARLLSSFRAVHGGVKHQDLLMQAYGGSLFDPDRYPFLEGRPANSLWRNTAAEPMAVNNRVVLHLLNSLQRLRIKPGPDGVAETRRISFRALGVEQIGHVYEGLLDHTGVLATEPVLGIKGTRNKEAEISLTKLESLLAHGQDKLVGFLKEETGRSLSAIRKTLDDGSLLDEHKLMVASGHDQALLTRLRPFAGLIREDSFERPLVVLTGSVYVTAGTDRRSSGTHYTPPTLTEPIVKHTLEPLVYQGPADGWPRAQWTLKSPKDILNLKVCDMAMGSGAFLVQVCRYLAERLVEAWENEEKLHPGEVLITPEGKFSAGSPTERLVPAEAAERIAIAKRVIADRCLYGVDINPMAVEMAKLSLWLVTVDANRPFTFLDHALKCGDSLLGVTTLEQLENFSLRPEGGKQQAFSTLNLWRHIEEAKSKRETLESMPSDTPEQIIAKSALNSEAEDAVVKLSAAADVLVAMELAGTSDRKYEEKREIAADLMMTYWAKGLADLQKHAFQTLGGRRCFHWVLSFPEIIESGGFDALVGNPPFLGGKRISGVMGGNYRDFLVQHIGGGVKGHADLSAYFFLRVGALMGQHSMAGLLATNTIAQGDTREVGLDQLTTRELKIVRAVPSMPWPGTAALEVAHVWLRRGKWVGGFELNDRPVYGITPMLTAAGQVTGKPYRLNAYENTAFVGSFVLGLGFVLEPDEATALIVRNPKNRDCLFPYLNGEDFNSRSDQTPSRWVINFFDWPLNRSAAGSWTSADNKHRKEWLQSGIVPLDYPDPVADDYPDLIAILEERVKKERTRKNASGEYALRYPLYLKWWIYADKRPALYTTIKNMERVLVTARVSPTNSLSWTSVDQVFHEKIVIFPRSESWFFTVLQSSIHWEWAVQYTSTLGATTLNYSLTDCFETFPFPILYEDTKAVGERFHQCRQTIMKNRNEGLTKTYNRFHNPADTSADIAELRQLYIELDLSVTAAYAWTDLNLDHDFNKTKQGVRFTICESARRELLDRLLGLNHLRHAEEEAAKTAVPVSASANRSRKKIVSPLTPGLFD